MFKKDQKGTIAAKRSDTQKAQLIANQKTAEIVVTAFSHDDKHDFQLFKDNKLDIAEHIPILADVGY